MFRLNKSRGIGFINVICSLAILMIAITYITSFKVREIKLKKYNAEMNKSVVLMEALRNEITYNYTYDEIKELFVNCLSLNNGKYISENKLFINGDNLNLDSLNTKGLREILDKFENNKETYLEITANNDEEKIIKINLTFFINGIQSNKIISTTLYKGEY